MNDNIPADARYLAVWKNGSFCTKSYPDVEVLAMDPADPPFLVIDLATMEAVDALSAQQAAGEAVAWLYQPWEDADVWLCQIVEPSQCHAKKPLYAAPQPEAPAEGEAK